MKPFQLVGGVHRHLVGFELVDEGKRLFAKLALVHCLRVVPSDMKLERVLGCEALAANDAFDHVVQVVLVKVLVDGHDPGFKLRLAKPAGGHLRVALQAVSNVSDLATELPVVLHLGLGVEGDGPAAPALVTEPHARVLSLHVCEVVCPSLLNLVAEHALVVMVGPLLQHVAPESLEGGPSAPASDALVNPDQGVVFFRMLVLQVLVERLYRVVNGSAVRAENTKVVDQTFFVLVPRVLAWPSHVALNLGVLATEIETAQAGVRPVLGIRVLSVHVSEEVLPVVVKVSETTHAVLALVFESLEVAVSLLWKEKWVLFLTTSLFRWDSSGRDT